ncbi:hypothetical protein [Chryseobacterium sp.]|uniref:hypothetical protein n=1 Tax=Chryseobacterium sp. TaxID=1871047 RepID=UPI0024E21930|nr:hypothetical protein [Chryseobacterium sp.]
MAQTIVMQVPIEILITSYFIGQFIHNSIKILNIIKMATIIIALFAVIVLMIQKAESTVNNKDVLVKIDQFHSKIKLQILGVVHGPYAETRQKSTKWIAFLFILVAILHYLSVGIFGANSVHNLLSDKKGLVFIILIMIIAIGHFNRKDLLRVGIVIAFVSSVMIYTLHNNIVSIAGTELLLAGLPIGLVWKDTFVILGAIAFFLTIILFVLFARMISFMLYLTIRSAFKLCLYLAPTKPLKALIVMVECTSILGIAIMSVI